MGRGDATLGTRLWLAQKRLQQDRQTLEGPSDPAPGIPRGTGAPSGAPELLAMSLWFIARSLSAGEQCANRHLKFTNEPFVVQSLETSH